jgi:hypothetical protein
MNLALDEFCYNSIIDDLVEWPPRSQRILTVRGCSTLFRRPFIVVKLADGEFIVHHFARDSFAEHWAEAVVILKTLTTIETISDFDYPACANQADLVAKMLRIRDESIVDSNLMYGHQLYQQFLDQYGEDCKNLPADTVAKIANARSELAIKSV